MKSYLYTLFDAVFPPSADELALRRVSDDEFTIKLRVGAAGGVVTLLSFDDQAVRAAVHLAKFHNHRRATMLLGKVLAVYLALRQDSLIILPVPLSKSRYRERGYNQVEQIVDAALTSTSGHRILTHVLVKRLHTAPQTSLSRNDRLTNVADAFGVRDVAAARALIDGQHVLLVDDVTTTGATLKAAKAALLPLQPASVTCIALAH